MKKAKAALALAAALLLTLSPPALAAGPPASLAGGWPGGAGEAPLSGAPEDGTADGVEQPQLPATRPPASCW